MDEKYLTFVVTVKVTKSVPGELDGDVNYDQLVKKLKINIEEAVCIQKGSLNSYLMGKVSTTNDEEEEGYSDES